jgi:hypothetical protein
VHGPHSLTEQSKYISKIHFYIKKINFLMELGNHMRYNLMGLLYYLVREGGSTGMSNTFFGILFLGHLNNVCITVSALSSIFGQQITLMK